MGAAGGYGTLVARRCTVEASQAVREACRKGSVATRPGKAAADRWRARQCRPVFTLDGASSAGPVFTLDGASSAEPLFTLDGASSDVASSAGPVFTLDGASSAAPVFTLGRASSAAAPVGRYRASCAGPVVTRHGSMNAMATGAGTRSRSATACPGRPRIGFSLDAGLQRVRGSGGETRAEVRSQKPPRGPT